jgi:hypothetical protein
MEEQQPTSLQKVVKIVYLNRYNTEFYRKGDFLAAKIQDQEGEEKRDVGRIILHRMFPFSELWTNISVQDPMGEEFGLIRDLNDFDQEDQEVLKKELESKYFVPKILSIQSVKERFGFSNWRVTTDVGPISFVVRDTYRSMILAGANRIIILDSDGNRYEIPNTEQLDNKSYKKIELYL